MKKSCLSLVLIFFLFIAMPLVFSQEIGLTDSEIAGLSKTQNTTLYFFHSEKCPHCKEAILFLDELEKKYKFELKAYELSNFPENSELYTAFLEEYNVPKPWGYVPAFFMKGEYIIGFDSPEGIGKQLESLINSCISQSEENCTNNPSKTITFSLFGKQFSIKRDYSLLLISIILGLADGFNPCTFAVLIFFLSYLMTISSRKRVLKLGLIFTFMIFLIYTSLMLGIVTSLESIPAKDTIKKVVGFIIIVFGLLNIKDFWFKGYGPSLAIPKFARPALEKYIRKATVPSVLILSFILSFVELACTVGIPLSFSAILIDRGLSLSSKLIYILIYNIFYVLPLIIIVLAVYFALLEVSKAEEIRAKFKRFMKIIGGLAMTLIGILLVTGLI